MRKEMLRREIKRIVDVIVRSAHARQNIRSDDNQNQLMNAITFGMRGLAMWKITNDAHSSLLFSLFRRYRNSFTLTTTNPLLLAGRRAVVCCQPLDSLLFMRVRNEIVFSPLPPNSSERLGWDEWMRAVLVSLIQPTVWKLQIESEGIYFYELAVRFCCLAWYIY